MYDSVKLWDPSITLFENNRILSRLVNVREEYIPSTGEINYRGQLSNLRVRIYSSRLCVEGSWPKYIRGNNLQSLSRQETKTVIEKLSDELGISIANAKVSSLEIAETFIMNNSISYYTGCLGSLRYCERRPFNKGLMYFNKRKALKFYDKAEEMHKNNQLIQKDLLKKHLLRYELKLNKKLASQLNLATITANMLCKTEFFNRLIEKWQKEYFSINRINKPTIYNITPIKTAKQLDRLLAVNGLMAIGEQQILSMITSDKNESSKMQRCRLKRRVNEHAQDKNFTKPSEFIIELDEKIRNTFLSYLV